MLIRTVAGTALASMILSSAPSARQTAPAPQPRTIQEQNEEMIKELRRSVNLELIRTNNDKLQTVEGEADKLVVELLRDLYTGKHEPLKVVFLKDVVELLAEEN